MATIKVFSLGGLDKKSNDLTRATDKASDMLNMEYDTQSTLKKRNGYELFSSLNSDDFIYYNSKDEFLLFENNSANVTVLSGDGLTTKTLPLPSGISSMTNISISSCENQNNLYFTNTDFNTYVMKYDGSNLYRAGLPTPRKSQATKYDIYPSISAGGISGFYTRIFYSYKDINGNITYSPYVQLDKYGSSANTLSINSLAYDANCLENGFYNKYCFRSATTTQTISSASRTLNTTSHNYIAGDKFLMDTENACITISPSYKTFIVLEVESVVPNTSITFTAASFDIFSVSFSTFSSYNQGVNQPYPVDIRCLVYTATSSNPDANFIINGRGVVDNSSSLNTIYCLGYDNFNFKSKVVNQNIPFEDIYDSSTLKIMPPICKYLASYGNQIIYSSIQSFFTGYTNQSSTPNQRVQYANNDLIVYSDISTGDGPENVSELNLVKIGETWDGEITGARRCNDSMIIFKNRGVFSIDGALIDGEFQLRKITTNFAGCTSHKSILEADEGLYFQAHNGLYFTNAIGVKKISYEIDSVFGSAEYTSTRSVRLKKKQKSLFYVPQLSKIVVIDYYYNQIYFWDSIVASNGFVENSTGDVFFSNGSNIYKFNNNYSDAGSAINAYYSTTWHHAGEPALNKKWLSIRTFALTNDAFTATITAQGDWDTSTFYGYKDDGTKTTNPLFGSNGIFLSNSMQFGLNDQTKFVMFDMKTKRSFRVKFSNNILNESLVITGYEINFEVFNSVDKN